MLLEKEAIPKKIGFISGSKVGYTKEKRCCFSSLTKGYYEPVQPKNANTKFKIKKGKNKKKQRLNLDLFLAVQDSSIGDLVSE